MTTIVLIFCAIISTVYTLPLQLQLLQPFLQQQNSLQQQLMVWQQLQALQRMNLMQQNQIPPRPLLILLPKSHNRDRTDEDIETKHNINLRKSDTNAHHGIVNEDMDSVIIDAETKPEETQKAILLIPNEGRFSLGDFISSIPFLPIEINVPDSISWIYNGISSIISGIGQRLPFRPQTQDTRQSSEDEANSRIKTLNRRTVMPILLMPLAQPLPYQI